MVLPRYPGHSVKSSLIYFSWLTHFPLVIKSFDVIKDVGPGFRAGLVMTSLDSFTLEHTKKDLGSRVVVTTSHSTHAGRDVVVLQETLILVAGKLRTTI